MNILGNKIDFIATLKVVNANPNGDPLNGNIPRTDFNGFGIISDVCVKRKIRNRLQSMGNNIFVKSNDSADDGFKSLESRFGAKFDTKVKDEDVYSQSCLEWLDVRSFGQVMTYQKRSIGIRGPVSISMAKSTSPVNIETMQITRSSNSMEKKNKETGEAIDGRSSDTMGSKHYVEKGIYILKGSINPYFAEKTGFSEEDAYQIKEAIKTLFVNDMSSARPEGSMEVKELFWFKHNCKTGNVSTAKVHGLLKWEKLDFESRSSDFDYEELNIHLDEEKLNEYKELGLQVEVYEGL